MIPFRKRRTTRYPQIKHRISFQNTLPHLPFTDSELDEFFRKNSFWKKRTEKAFLVFGNRDALCHRRKSCSLTPTTETHYQSGDAGSGNPRPCFHELHLRGFQFSFKSGQHPVQPHAFQKQNPAECIEDFRAKGVCKTGREIQAFGSAGGL